MAEASSQDNLTAEEKEESEAEKESPQQTPVPPQKREEEEELECAVCLQKCVHPVRLPCSHIFCFLCVKGVANQSKRCAMCRQEIPADFLDHPTLLSSIEAEKEEVLPGGYQWFYEGRNGWWQYDERTSHELEAAYGSGQRACEVLVAGFLYIIDFDRMIQLRRNDPSRRRRIKRDLSSIPKKGVAGIKLPSQLEAELSALHSAADAVPTPDLDHGGGGGGVGGDGDHISSSLNNNDLCPPTPTAPSNTPQTPHTPSAASSSSGSPDTTDHALASESHHHHYHYLPHHHHHLHYHQLHIPHHLVHNLNSYNDHNILEHSIHAAHHLHHQPGQHHHHHHHPPPAPPPPPPPPPPPVPPANQQQPLPQPPPPTHSRPGSSPPPAETQTGELQSPAVSSSSPPPQAPLGLDDALYPLEQLSLATDAAEFYPLDSTEDSADETEQYHLTLSSEDEQL
ncbi:E3 ubiquitin-protein ligase RNF146-like [Penaeus japonicus]|uniref:E3 ubiquitin-protein ligase RNF146-like n=1 Tax=Penaeus japonicus TaxID=27405 RepID=UPI001C710494|nr:E3 ubiquitin-protein ligase RNF146-like [Penaeus japonicus]